ncbi:MAG: response regulator transcription factor [Pirellulaceae bacterium]|nr:response regulator transcription factor [Pirellulaceae bacterium]
MTQRTILTIEDDDAIRRGIADSLTFAGYHVLQAATGDEGLQMALTRSYHLLLLDLILPGTSGAEVLRAVRTDHPTVPIIMLTAQGTEKDRVQGLESGADDYVVKPFSVKELLARVEAVLRRSPERPSDITQIHFTGGTVDFSRREIRLQAGSRAEMSEKEAELLRYLAIHSGRAVARNELLSHVWGLNPQGISTRTIDMHIARLREKLNDDPTDSHVLLTVRGKGYMFTFPDDSSHRS